MTSVSVSDEHPAPLHVVVQQEPKQTRFQHEHHHHQHHMTPQEDHQQDPQSTQPLLVVAHDTTTPALEQSKRRSSSSGSSSKSASIKTARRHKKQKKSRSSQSMTSAASDAAVALVQDQDVHPLPWFHSSPERPNPLTSKSKQSPNKSPSRKHQQQPEGGSNHMVQRVILSRDVRRSKRRLIQESQQPDRTKDHQQQISRQLPQSLAQAKEYFTANQQANGTSASQTTSSSWKRKFWLCCLGDPKADPNDEQTKPLVDLENGRAASSSMVTVATQDEATAQSQRFLSCLIMVVLVCLLALLVLMVRHSFLAN